MKEYIDFWKKFLIFSGRSSRKDYWMFTLINFGIVVLLQSIDYALSRNWDRNPQILLSIYGLAILLPTVGVTIRRLHDIDKSGWWILLNLIPLVGFIWSLVLMTTPGDHGDNKYGADPYAEIVESSNS
jgi:uncharacterized membrane protein YhaH (DUF805 family)